MFSCVLWLYKIGFSSRTCRPDSDMWSSEHINWRRTGNASVMQHWSAFVQPFLQWKSNMFCIFWVCVCSLRYPACNAHATYCYLWPAPLYDVSQLYLTKGAVFVKKLSKIKWVSIFFTTLKETFLTLRKTERDMIKNVFWSSRKVAVILVRI